MILDKAKKFLADFVNNLSSTQILIFGFLLLDLIGSILLWLPICNK